MSEIKLPELPEPTVNNLFNADKVQAYARQAVTDALAPVVARAEKAEAELAALREAVRGLVAKWRALAQVIREMKGGRNYRFPGKSQIAAHIDDCADELEAALATKPAKGGEG